MDKAKRIELSIYGYQPSSFCDYPGKTASVFFTAGCNMNCSYCHNMAMMKNSHVLSIDEIYACVKHAAGNKLSDAIVVSGGEPTLQGRNLINFIRFLKETSNKKIKLDTNGTNFDILYEIINDKLIDFIAMDIKSNFDDYKKFCYYGNPESLYKSVDMILKSGLEHQFRCTVGSEFSRRDFKFINNYFPDIKLQQYKRLN